MRLLVVYPYIPYPVDRGTYQRTFHLLKALARDHDVDFFALSEGGERLDQQHIFTHFCHRVAFAKFEHPAWPRLVPDRLIHALPTTVRHWRLPAVADALDRFIGRRHYDLAHVCDIVMAQYFLKDHRRLRLVVDRSRVDLEFQIAQHHALGGGLRQKILDWENLAKLERFEKQVARRTALQVVCGPDDAVFIRKHISTKVPVHVLVNGVDLDYFQPGATSEPRAIEPTVLFCGAMDYTPNVDALRWYFGEIHERLKQQVPGLKLLIVGKSPVPEVQAYGRKAGVTVTGGVPDVRPYYRQAWLQIVPLRIGGGTRLKIPESMAMNTPVVSTTIGAQGLNLIHNEEILLADTPELFASETARALRDTALRAKLEMNGQAVVQARFGWPQLGRQLSQLYDERFAS